jgi:phospholipase C
MQTRREFLKNAALLSGAIGLWGSLDGSIVRALAIEPEPGSSYLDAEHIVILMQENRSFDHCYGTLQGVRGYNDPRAITLANGNPVWVQRNAAGESYAPFRLNLKDTKATWMGYLPHNWASQVDARNGGQYDRWLEAKRSGHKAYADMPLTLGHYNRQDVPFYYALADAFTVCDQHFCSALTSTLPNRLYYWTGTIREKPSPDSPAYLNNTQIMRNHWGTDWTTFPERLEDHGVSWKFYQNELWTETGLSEEEVAWLSNFGCNVMEYFPQFHVIANPRHREYVLKEEPLLPDQIAGIKRKLSSPGLSEDESFRLRRRMEDLSSSLRAFEQQRKSWDREEFNNLPPRAKSLYEKAFCTNVGDPSYRQLAELTYKDGEVERRVQVPKGDVFHQFRQDVKTGKLPTVTWLVAPERLSDHPESAWYGAWYISETLRILTENPEVWKKTIFILTYDENDGYFDHVPPFVAPRPDHPETGFCSEGLDTRLEYVELEEDRKMDPKTPRESPIGLGYRVPMVIASPWTRGGCVCSQVFDNTSVLMFLETFLTNKTGRKIRETNISSWRRGICGDLTSAFQSSSDEKEANPQYLARDPLVEEIYQAKFKPLPTDYKALSRGEVEQIRRDPRSSQWMPDQERGIRRSCPLPYELYVDGSLSADRTRFTIRLAAGGDVFGGRSAGCPFTVYARTGNDRMTVRNYAVIAGDKLEDSWALSDFAGGVYRLQVYGPNGFFREFLGSADDPLLDIQARYSQLNAAKRVLSGNIELRAVNRDGHRGLDIEIADRSYKTGAERRSISAGGSVVMAIDTQRSFRWYDFGLKIEQDRNFERRFAGRVETGQWSFSDPAMGGVVG